MLIGLYDHDLTNLPKIVTPSIDLMQYSSYYKGGNHIVKMIPDLSNIDPYDKIIVRWSKGDKPQFKMSDDKFEWVGTSFFGGKTTRPVIEVNSCLADSSIYYEWFAQNKQYVGMRQKRVFLAVFDCGAARLVYNGEKVINKKMPLRTGVVLYDSGIYTSDVFKNEILQYPDLERVKIIIPQYIQTIKQAKETLEIYPDMRSMTRQQHIVFNLKLTYAEYVNHFWKYSNEQMRQFHFGFPPMSKYDEYYDYVRWNILNLGRFVFKGISENKRFKIARMREPGLPRLLLHFAYFITDNKIDSDYSFVSYCKLRYPENLRSIRELLIRYPELKFYFTTSLLEVNHNGRMI